MELYGGEKLTEALIVFQSAGRVQRTRIYIESYVDHDEVRHVVIGHAAYPFTGGTRRRFVDG